MVQNRIEEGQNEFSSEAVTELIKVKNQVWVINMTHYLGRFSFKRWISAISFSGLGPGISKRFFASYSWLSVVSQKNMDFFRNCPITRWSADHFRLVLYRRRGTFIFRNMSIWVSNWSISSSGFIFGHFPPRVLCFHDFSWTLGFQI